ERTATAILSGDGAVEHAARVVHPWIDRHRLSVASFDQMRVSFGGVSETAIGERQRIFERRRLRRERKRALELSDGFRVQPLRQRRATESGKCGGRLRLH